MIRLSTHGMRSHALARESSSLRTPWRARLGALTCLTAVLLGGCALPRTGPMAGEVRNSAAQGKIDLRMASADLVTATQVGTTSGFPGDFTAATVQDYERLSAGDSVQVKIWERDGLGLFNPGSDGGSDLGELTVDKDGFIQIPYAGNIGAAGLNESQLRQVINARLKTLIIAPEVSVRASQRQGKTVVAQGDLSKPGLFNIGPGVQRLSALLALAAPSGQNPEQVAVSVRRSTGEGSVRLADIYGDRAQDIALRPGDVVMVHDVIETVTILGAMRNQGRVKVTKRRYSVMDALADARGLDDAAANPKAVYMMRKADSQWSSRDGWQPTVYQFDFTKPEQLLLASNVMLRDGDAIYVSDAPFTQTTKLLSAFSLSVSTLRAGAGIAQ